MSKPHLGGVEYEVGDVVPITFYPTGPDGQVYGPVQARIVSWDEEAETIEFEMLDGTSLEAGLQG